MWGLSNISGVMVLETLWDRWANENFQVSCFTLCSNFGALSEIDVVFAGFRVVFAEMMWHFLFFLCLLNCMLVKRVHRLLLYDKDNQNRLSREIGDNVWMNLVSYLFLTIKVGLLFV